MVSRKEEPDVIGYIGWLNNAMQGKACHMATEEAFDFIISRLVPLNEEEKEEEPIIVPPQTEQTNKSHSIASSKPIIEPIKSLQLGDKANFKGMKGRSWQLLTDAWSGNMQPDSLNHWIRQLSLYMPFKFANQNDAVSAIEHFIDELPDWSFSDRLSSGRRF